MQKYTPPLYHWPSKLIWKSSVSNEYKWTSFSCYIHYPFCRSICEFCGYETRLKTKSNTKSYLEELVTNIRNHGESDDFSKAKFRSLFFGGGTASLIPEESMELILNTFEEIVGDLSKVEITLECEPGTITASKLKKMHELGVNRISVCAQSLDNKQLRVIKRKHSHEESMQLITDCIDAGFKNIHIDLMYGLPKQTLSTWEDTLRACVKLPVTHISAYKLYVFKHGKLERDNIVARPENEDIGLLNEVKLMSDATTRILGEAGFEQYSLTEYARPGFQCEYIKSCFNGDDLLPIGSSSHGRNGNEIWDNSPYVHLYGKKESKQFNRAIHLTNVQSFKRDIILGLWLLKVDVLFLSNKHNVEIHPELLKLFNALSKEGLITFDGKTLSLLPEHRFFVGDVMVRMDNFEINSWAMSDENQHLSRTIIPSITIHSNDIEVELSSVVRMARSDPKFFQYLKREPENCLAELGYVTDDSNISAFVNAINDGGTEGKEEVDQAKRIWIMIEKEHMNKAI